MAIQAQMYTDNLPLMGGSTQDYNTINPPNLNYYYSSSSNYNNPLNGCGLNDLNYYSLPQKLQHQQQYLLQDQNYSTQKPFNDANTISGSTTTTSSDHQLPMNNNLFNAQLEEQNQEVARYISIQSKRLQVALEEQRQHEVGIILRDIEVKTKMMLKEKEDEMVKGKKRRGELEGLMRKLEMEKEAWQKLGEEKEAMVLALNNALEQVKDKAAASQWGEDVESCCNDNNTSNNRMMTMVCRVCKDNNATLLLLPCRHLCLCTSCNAFVHACPLCKSVKKASLEVILS